MLACSDALVDICAKGDECEEPTSITNSETDVPICICSPACEVSFVASDKENELGT